MNWLKERSNKLLVAALSGMLIGAILGYVAFGGSPANIKEVEPTVTTETVSTTPTLIKETEEIETYEPNNALGYKKKHTITREYE